MTQPCFFHEDITQHAPLPPDGILSRTLHAGSGVKIIQFCFAPGQELSAHTAPMPALLHFVQGEAELQLGSDIRNVRQGALAWMPPRLEHAIRAKTEVVMLLVMLRESS